MTTFKPLLCLFSLLENGFNRLYIIFGDHIQIITSRQKERTYHQNRNYIFHNQYLKLETQIQANCECFLDRIVKSVGTHLYIPYIETTEHKRIVRTEETLHILQFPSIHQLFRKIVCQL